MAKVVVTIDKNTAEATYDVQEVEGQECLKLTETIRARHGVDAELKDEYFVETVEEVEQ